MELTAFRVWVFALMRPLLWPANRVMVLIGPKTETERQSDKTDKLCKHCKASCLNSHPQTHICPSAAVCLVKSIFHIWTPIWVMRYCKTKMRRPALLGSVFLTGGKAEWSGSFPLADMLEGFKLFVVQSVSWQGVKLSDCAEMSNMSPCCSTSHLRRGGWGVILLLPFQKGQALYHWMGLLHYSLKKTKKTKHADMKWWITKDHICNRCSLYT